MICNYPGGAHISAAMAVLSGRATVCYSGVDKSSCGISLPVKFFFLLSHQYILVVISLMYRMRQKKIIPKFIWFSRQPFGGIST